MTIMREFIIADNQDITKAGMMFLLSRQKDTALLLEADNKAELIQQLRLHPTAVVILDYTLFDFSGSRRANGTSRTLQGSRLATLFRRIEPTVPAPGIVQQHGIRRSAERINSKEEILTALQCASRKERFICNHVSNLLLAGNGSSPPLILPSKMIY